MIVTAEELAAQLRQQAREHRQEARRLDTAVKVLLEPQKTKGRPQTPNKDLYDAFKASGLQYKELAAKLGVGYRYVSWVVRGIDDKPKLEGRIREVLAPYVKDEA
jgi:hypothetical protein